MLEIWICDFLYDKYKLKLCISIHVFRTCLLLLKYVKIDMITHDNLIPYVENFTSKQYQPFNILSVQQ